MQCTGRFLGVAEVFTGDLDVKGRRFRIVCDHFGYRQLTIEQVVGNGNFVAAVVVSERHVVGVRDGVALQMILFNDMIGRTQFKVFKAAGPTGGFVQG